MGWKAVFMKIKSEDFPDLIKDTNPQAPITQLILGMTNKKKANLRHIFVKVQSPKIRGS